MVSLIGQLTRFTRIAPNSGAPLCVCVCVQIQFRLDFIDLVEAGVPFLLNGSLGRSLMFVIILHVIMNSTN